MSSESTTESTTPKINDKFIEAYTKIKDHSLSLDNLYATIDCMLYMVSGRMYNPPIQDTEKNHIVLLKNDSKYMKIVDLFMKGILSDDLIKVLRFDPKILFKFDNGTITYNISVDKTVDKTMNVDLGQKIAIDDNTELTTNEDNCISHIFTIYQSLWTDTSIYDENTTIDPLSKPTIVNANTEDNMYIRKVALLNCIHAALISKNNVNLFRYIFTQDNAKTGDTKSGGNLYDHLTNIVNNHTRERKSKNGNNTRKKHRRR